MKTNIAVISLVLIICLCTSVPGFLNMETGTGSRLDEFFGPLPKYGNLITGVDVDGFVASLYANNVVPYSASRNINEFGVAHYYGLNLGKETVDLSIRLGVFEDNKAANAAFCSRIDSSSVSLPMVKGCGDRAVECGKRGAVILLNNVVFDINSVNHETRKNVASTMLSALIDGSMFVSNGKLVPVPRIIKAELPERVGLSKQAKGRIVFAETGLRGLVVGNSRESKIRAEKDGAAYFITYTATSFSQFAGQQKVNLYAATSRNVMASKEISILVE